MGAKVSHSKKASTVGAFDGGSDSTQGIVTRRSHKHHADGEIGHIENFMIDDADWSIHYFIVDTGNWWCKPTRGRAPIGALIL